MKSQAADDEASAANGGDEFTHRRGAFIRLRDEFNVPGTSPGDSRDPSPEAAARRAAAGRGRSSAASQARTRASESRITTSGTNLRETGRLVPWRVLISMRQAFRPMSAMGMCTLVRRGESQAATSASS